ncbi:MAG TPA: CoA transferase [Dehalococcoidia bacterium]|nr:CoA transferase [Dehalococcoidia bacterium]
MEPHAAAALPGLRVVEAGSGVSAAYAGKLLCDLGAEVLKVEPPGGDETRARGPFPRGREGDPKASGLFIYLNWGKQLLSLDLATDTGRAALFEQLAGADLFIHNFGVAEIERLGLGYEALAARFPQLIVTSITPFGLSGPHARWQGTNLTVVSAGGWASITPGNSPLTNEPPLAAFGQQAEFQAAVHAAVASLGALHARRRDGRGQLVEVSGQECIAAALELALVTYTYTGRIASRLGIRTSAPMGIMRCNDGLIFVMTTDPHQWDALVRVMGNPEWASWEIFSDRFKRGEHHDALTPLIEEWLSERTVQEVFDLAAQARLPFAPVSTIADIVHSPHLKERGYFVALRDPLAGELTVPGAPYLLSETPWAPGGGIDDTEGEGAGNSSVGALREVPPMTHGAQPRVIAIRSDEERGAAGAVSHGEASAPLQPAHASQSPAPFARRPAPSQLPLAGLRVVDMSWMWAGPYCTLQLAHLGAEVIRIESQHRPCMNRRVPPYAGDRPGLNRGGSFNQWNQGKGSVLLDLKKPEAVQLARELVATADVFVENYAVGVVDRLGLGWDVLSQINPGLVMASLSGYGASGPYKDRVAFGTPLTMISGLGQLTGYVGRGPAEVGISYGDPNGGLHAAFAILAALWKRHETGRGQYIDVSQWEALLSILPEGILPYTMRGEQPARRGNRDEWLAPHGIFRAKGQPDAPGASSDDRWVSIVVRDDPEWARLAPLLDEAAADPRFVTRAGRKACEDELEAIVTAWTRERDAWAITEQLQALGIPAAPVMDMRDVAEDPHLNQRGFYVRLEHPEVGVQQHAGIPWKLHGTPLHVREPAPCMGEDNEYVVMQLLGRSRAEYERLLAAQVLY